MIIKSLAPDVSQSEIVVEPGPLEVCAALRHPGQPVVYLDGSGFDDGWTVGALVGIEPTEVPLAPGAGDSDPISLLHALERVQPTENTDPCGLLADDTEVRYTDMGGQDTEYSLVSRIGLIIFI